MRVHRSRSPARYPSSGGTRPMFAAIGSTRIAATSAPCSASAASSAAKIVVGNDDRVGDGAGRDAGRTGQPERRDTAPRLRRAARRRGRGSNPRTSRSSPGRSRRVRAGPRSSRPRCPTTRAAPSPPTEPGRRSPRPARPRAGWARRTTCRRPRPCCTASTTAGMRVAEDRRAPRLHVVDVLAAVGVDEVRAVRRGRRRTGLRRPSRTRGLAS